MATILQKDARIPEKLKVLILGDSITDNGLYVAFMDAYFRLHRPELQITLIPLGVSSETASGLSENSHPFPRPCVHERLARALTEAKPDWVIACYGMNDGIYHPYSEERFAAYQGGMLQLIGKAQAAGAKAIVVTPPPFDPPSKTGGLFLPEGAPDYSYETPYRDYDQVLARYGEWLLSPDCPADAAVDIHTPMAQDIAARRRADPAYSSGDGIHPDACGHWVMAKAILGRLFNVHLERMPDYVEKPEEHELFRLVLERHQTVRPAWKEHVGHTNPDKEEAALPLAEALAAGRYLEERIGSLLQETDRRFLRSTFKDGVRTDEFYWNGRECTVLCPEEPAPGRPWVWRTEFLYAFDQADRELLARGWHVAYIRLSDMYGCASALEEMKGFKQRLETAYGLAPRSALFGFSRGGFYAIRYAAAFPGDVSSIYLDAPVIRLNSWPGGYGGGARSSGEWADCLAVYGLPEEKAGELEELALESVKAVAAAELPVILVAGLADEAVPYAENGALLVQYMEEARGAGKRFRVITKEHGGHHPHSLEDPGPVVQFVRSAFYGNSL